MSTVQSDADALLVAIPMLAFLLMTFFRLDELVSRPKKRPENGRRLSDWDKDGRPICTDPVRTVYAVVRRQQGAGRKS
jgi:hypothetical protein